MGEQKSKQSGPEVERSRKRSREGQTEKARALAHTHTPIPTSPLPHHPSTCTYALDGVCAKEVPCTARADTKLVEGGVRVGPEEIAHGPLVWDLHLAVNDADAIDRVQRGREAAVHTQHPVINERSQGQVVKHVCAQAADAKIGGGAVACGLLWCACVLCMSE